MAKTKTPTTDAVTLQLINEVKRRKQEIATAEKPQYTTNCSFSYTENGANVVNIHVEANVGNLLRIAAFLLEREQSYAEAAQQLGVESPPPFSWAGFSVKDWLGDIRMRLAKVQIADKRKKLEALEARLGSIISPELRAKMELEQIAQELGT